MCRSEPLNAFPAGAAGPLGRACPGPAGTGLHDRRGVAARRSTPLKLAIDELRAGRVDAMLCGRHLTPRSALHPDGILATSARSSARGKAAPLDHQGDGLVVAEGAGMFVLKPPRRCPCSRRSYLRRVVAGIGLSNDIHGDLRSPRAPKVSSGPCGWPINRPAGARTTLI